MLREALARYDISWRTELAARARALEVGDEYAPEASRDRTAPNRAPAEDLDTPSLPVN